MAAYSLQYHTGQGWRVKATFIAELDEIIATLPARGENLRIIDEESNVMWQNEDARKQSLADDLKDQIQIVRGRLKAAADNFEPITLQPNEAMLLFRVLSLAINQSDR